MEMDIPFEPLFDLEEADSISFDFGPMPPITTQPSLGEEQRREASVTLTLPPLPVYETSSHEDDEQLPEIEKGEKRPSKKRVTRREEKETPSHDDDDAEEQQNSDIQYDPRTRKGNAFDFSREEVQKITPADLEAYEVQVRAHHTPSAAELAMLKKYRRQIRNRASAQNSRARKRQHTSTLERTVEELTQDRDMWRARAEKAEARLAQLEPKNRNRGLGLVLAVVLSVGLCGLLVLPGGSPPVPGALSLSSGSTGRRLLAAPLPQVPQLPPSSSSSASSSPSTSPRGPDSRVRIVEEEPMSLSRVHSKPSPHADHWDRPETDYLYCPTASHVLSTAAGTPERVSLILPGDAFNSSTMATFRGPDAPDLVEVTCSVVDFWPVYLNRGNRLQSSA